MGLQVHMHSTCVYHSTFNHQVEIYSDQKVYWFTGLHIWDIDTLEYSIALVCMVYRFTGLQCYKHFDMSLS